MPSLPRSPRHPPDGRLNPDVHETRVRALQLGGHPRLPVMEKIEQALRNVEDGPHNNC